MLTSSTSHRRVALPARAILFPVSPEGRSGFRPQRSRGRLAQQSRQVLLLEIRPVGWKLFEVSGPGAAGEAQHGGCDATAPDVLVDAHDPAPAPGIVEGARDAEHVERRKAGRLTAEGTCLRRRVALRRLGVAPLPCRRALADDLGPGDECLQLGDGEVRPADGGWTEPQLLRSVDRLEHHPPGAVAVVEVVLGPGDGMDRFGGDVPRPPRHSASVREVSDRHVCALRSIEAWQSADHWFRPLARLPRQPAIPLPSWTVHVPLADQENRCRLPEFARRSPQRSSPPRSRARRRRNHRWRPATPRRESIPSSPATPRAGIQAAPWGSPAPDVRSWPAPTG